MLTDVVIATHLNDGLKHCITGSAKAATESSNPNLRATFAQISQEGIHRQAELARIMQQKGWYTAPPLNPADIQRLMPQLHALIQGTPQHAQEQSHWPQQQYQPHQQPETMGGTGRFFNQGQFSPTYHTTQNPPQGRPIFS